MGILLPLLYLSLGIGLALLLPERWGTRLKEEASTLMTRWIIPAVIIYTVATSRPELFFVAASTMVLMLRGALRHSRGCGILGRGSRASLHRRVYRQLHHG